VIYVGTVSIETDVEVLADGVVVGTALPFDATAYPDATLSVNFSYSVGGAPFVISTTARLAPLKLIQFRDTYFGLTIGAGNCWPAGSRTRQMTMALRVTGNFNTSATPADNVGVITASGAEITNNRFGGANTGRVRSVSPDPGNSFTGNLDFAAGANQSISFLAAVDYDGGLPGGEKFTVWWSCNGAAWSKLGGHANGPADARNVWLNVIGNMTPGNVAQGHFDIHNHIWLANVALDPSTSWPDFFNTDGTVKSLPSDGLVNGVLPVAFFVGDDFVTGVNRGTGGGTALRARTAATVVNA
jgi:hypothetical protein